MVGSHCYCYFLCLISLLLHTLASPTLSHCRHDQRDALLEFKDEFPNLRDTSLSSWNKSSDCCSWVEVKCDDKSGEVISLELPSISLNSSLKPNSALFKLQHLTKLSLYNSSLYGEIPSSLRNLSSLTILDLSYNALVGQVPESLGNLSHLTFLDLSNNRLVGQVPASVGKLSNLTWLVLSDNQLVGKVLASLGNLTQLEYLNLGHNKFSGNIPVSFANLTKLREVYLNNNYFESTLPLDMSGFQELSYFDVGENSFSGPFPTSLFTVPNLMKVFLGKNQFTGPIEFRNISALTSEMVLYLDHNKFDGPVPKSIYKFLDLDFSYNSFSSFEKSSSVLDETPHINQLDFSSNSFQGPLPHWLCNLSSLSFLDLSNNRLSASILQCLRNLIVLEALIMSNNNFSGVLPDIFVNATNFKALDVSRNQLEGKLPKSLINCSFLQLVNVQSNRIKDEFPFWLGSLPWLNVLILRSNQFYGQLYHPHVSIGFQNLRIIDISHNGFTGSLPPFYFSYWRNMATSMEQAVDHDENLGNSRYGAHYYNSMEMVHKGVDTEFERIRRDFRAIDFSGNVFSGNIPESIGFLKELRVLNLSDNAFTSNIPQSLANLSNLEALDLSQNKLSGQIPRDLGSLSFLSIMNFSHNNLQGPIPRGTQFQRQKCSSFVDNPKLYGLDEICGETHVLNPTQQESDDLSESKEQVVNWIAVAIAYGPGVLCGMVIGHIFFPHKHEWFMEKFHRNKSKIVVRSAR